MMRRSEQEKAANRAAFQSLSFPAKLEHIWIYYKWFLILGAAALAIVGSVSYRLLTRKEPMLYIGLTNVAIGSEMEQTLNQGFVEAQGQDPAKKEVLLYLDLFISDTAEGESHKSAYASKVKLMASVENQQMDLLLMSKQAYDLLSAQGYLLNLNELLAEEPKLADAVGPLLTENQVILEDNAIEWELNMAEDHITKTESVANAIRISSLERLADYGLPEEVYYGVVANTPRRSACLDYLRYLLGAD